MELIAELYLLNSLAILTGFFVDVFFVNRQEVLILECALTKFNTFVARRTHRYNMQLQLVLSTIIIGLMIVFLLGISVLLMIKLYHYNRIILTVLMSLFYLNMMRIGIFETRIRKVMHLMSKSQYDDALQLLGDKQQVQVSFDFVKRAVINKIAFFSCGQVVAIFLYGFIGGIPLILLYVYFQTIPSNITGVSENNIFLRLLETVHNWMLIIPFYLTIALSLLACYALKLSFRYAFEVYKINSCLASFNFQEQLSLFYLASFDMPFEPIVVQNVEGVTYYEDIREIIKSLQLMKLVAFLIFIIVSFYFVIVIV